MGNDILLYFLVNRRSFIRYPFLLATLKIEKGEQFVIAISLRKIKGNKKQTEKIVYHQFLKAALHVSELLKNFTAI